MTKFDFYVEKLEIQRREEREALLNAELCRALHTKTKEEVVAELFENLIFFVGSSDVLTTNTPKTLVF